MTEGVTRRTLLKYTLASVVTCLSAAAGRTGVAVAAAFSSPSLNGPLSYATFAALIGQPFKLVVASKQGKFAIRMQLEEIVSVALAPGNDQFYLVFHVLSESVRPDGVYQIRHARAGSTKLFLQPMGDSVGGNYCRADFNLLT